MPADLAVKMAIATSMATIIFTSISSVRAHHKRGAVRWDIVKRLAPGIVIGSLIGSLGVFALLKGTALAIFFALFVGFSATQMFLDKKPKPTRQMPGTGGQLAAGGVIGFISGLVGAGGGFISVPFMTWCNVRDPQRGRHQRGAGLSDRGGQRRRLRRQRHGGAGPAGRLDRLHLAAGAGGDRDLQLLTAPLGARAAHSLPVKKLKRVFASILYVLAAYMLWKGLRG